MRVLLPPFTHMLCNDCTDTLTRHCGIITERNRPCKLLLTGVGEKGFLLVYALVATCLRLHVMQKLGITPVANGVLMRLKYRLVQRRNVQSSNLCENSIRRRGGVCKRH